MFFQRAAAYAAFRGSTLPSRAARPSSLGTERMYVGERCSIVTCAAVSASAGTSVTAVAPEPMTTTRLPAWSKSSGQCCGWMTSPVKSARPGSSGWCPCS